MNQFKETVCPLGTSGLQLTTESQKDSGKTVSFVNFTMTDMERLHKNFSGIAEQLKQTDLDVSIVRNKMLTADVRLSREDNYVQIVMSFKDLTSEKIRAGIKMANMIQMAHKKYGQVIKDIIQCHANMAEESAEQIPESMREEFFQRCTANVRYLGNRTMTILAYNGLGESEQKVLLGEIKDGLDISYMIESGNDNAILAYFDNVWRDIVANKATDKYFTDALGANAEKIRYLFEKFVETAKLPTLLSINDAATTLTQVLFELYLGSTPIPQPRRQSGMYC